MEDDHPSVVQLRFGGEIHQRASLVDNRDELAAVEEEDSAGEVIKLLLKRDLPGIVNRASAVSPEELTRGGKINRPHLAIADEGPLIEVEFLIQFGAEDDLPLIVQGGVEAKEAEVAVLRLRDDLESLSLADDDCFTAFREPCGKRNLTRIVDRGVGSQGAEALGVIGD